MNSWRFILLFIPAILVSCGDNEELPSRDEIPQLQQRLYDIEQAVIHHNQAELDSMLSVEILDNGQSSDSLFNFVYGSENNYNFIKLGDYSIFYNKEIAFIDCYIMDSLLNTDRPLRLHLKYDGGLWLLSRFSKPPLDEDST